MYVYSRSLVELDLQLLLGVSLLFSKGVKSARRVIKSSELLPFCSPSILLDLVKQTFINKLVR